LAGEVAAPHVTRAVVNGLDVINILHSPSPYELFTNLVKDKGKPQMVNYAT
jgi:hypothetical protein